MVFERIGAAGGAGGLCGVLMQARLPAGVPMAQFDIVDGVFIRAQRLRPASLPGRLACPLLLLLRHAQLDLGGTGGQRQQAGKQQARHGAGWQVHGGGKVVGMRLL